MGDNSLYAVQNQIRETLDALSEALENGQDFSPEEIEDTLNYLGDLESDKVDGIGFVVRECQSKADFLKAEAERLLIKARAHEASIARLKNYVLGVFQVNGLNKLAGQSSSLYIRNSKVVKLSEDFDPQTLPINCICFVPEKLEVDKPALAKQLKKGEIIDGAWLEDKPSLIIR